MSLDFQITDFVTVGLLIVLEGLLSADNALVMAVMVLGLPPKEHKKALSYGLIGAFGFRIVATVLAVYLIRIVWVKLIGGAYLLYLVYTHFWRGESDGDRHAPPRARPGFGLSAFWATVVRVELVNLAFSIDSILVAVAMSTKLWVVLSGGILGIIAMRVVVGQLLKLIQRYPAIIDGAFVIIAWVGAKLVADYAYQMKWIGWHVRTEYSLIVIVVIFVVAYLYARRHPHNRT